MVRTGQYIGYRYDMGFKIGNTAIPDPYKFTGAVSALDTLGKRDATGTLHRNMVATKHPLKIEYQNIEWSKIQEICALMTGESFSFTYNDPSVGLQTITAYVGDREWEAVRTVWNKPYIGNLKFSVIEY